MHASLPVAPHVFLFDQANFKVLLLLRSNTGRMDGYWSVPAGRLDEGESVSDGAKRELLEEAGVIAGQGGWNTPFVMHHQNENGGKMFFYFLCTEWSGVPTNMEPEKHGKLEWFPVDDLPENMVTHVRFALEKILQTEDRYFEWGFEG